MRESKGATEILNSVMETLDVMEESAKRGRLTKKQVVEFLDSMSYRTAPASDPIDNYELTVLTRLCRVLSRAVDSMATG